MLSALDELQQDLPSYCLNHSEELDEPSLRATVFRLLKATAHLRGAVRSSVRSCRAKIGVDRARSEGKPLGREPSKSMKAKLSARPKKEIRFQASPGGTGSRGVRSGRLLRVET